MNQQQRQTTSMRQATFLLLVTAAIAFYGGSDIARGAEIFVTNEIDHPNAPASHDIGEYDATTGTAVNASLVTGLDNETFRLAASGSSLYTVSYGVNGAVGKYNAATGATVNAALVPGLVYPQGIAVSGTSLFVALPTGGVRVTFLL